MNPVLETEDTEDTEQKKILRVVSGIEPKNSILQTEEILLQSNLRVGSWKSRESNPGLRRGKVVTLPTVLLH